MSQAAVATTTDAVTARPARAVAGGAVLSGAMALSGLLTYAFLVLAARRLGPEPYGRIGVLWGAMFIAAIILFRPLEQTTSRAIADWLARGDEARSVIRSVALLSAALVVAAAVTLPLVWGLLGRRLFHGHEFLTAMLVAGVAAYGLSYLVRGLVGGVRWFGGYGLGLIADGLVRLLCAAPLLFFASEDIAATALVAAGVAGAVVPLVYGYRRLRPVGAPGAGERFQLRKAAGFAGPAGAIAAADQLLVNGSPLLVAVAAGGHGGKTTGVVFAATMLVRAPVYVFQGLAAALLPNLTHLHATKDRALFRHAVRRTAVFLLGCGAVIVLGAAAVGPHAMGLYGSAYHASRLDIVLLAVGVAAYLPAATLSQAVLSLGSSAAAAVAWTTSAAAFVGIFAVLGGGDLRRVSLSFALAALTALALLAFALVRRLASSATSTNEQVPANGRGLSGPGFPRPAGGRSLVDVGRARGRGMAGRAGTVEAVAEEAI